MVSYPERAEIVVRSSGSAQPELPPEPLDLKTFLETELRKYFEAEEQALTIKLNAVRERLGKAPISQRKLNAMLKQKCSNCGQVIE